MENPNVTIQVQFDERKAAEVASFFLSRGRRSLSRWRLNKFMYLAEREAWRRFGSPMCGGDYSSRQYGPVVSDVLDLTMETGETSGGEIWSKHFENVGPDVYLRKPAKVAFLSQGELDVLRSVFHDFGMMPKEKLTYHMHNKLLEYRQTTERVKRWPIHVEDLLKVLGKSQDEIDQIAKRLNEAREIEESYRRLESCGNTA